MKINSFDDLVGNSLNISLLKKGLARKSLPNLILLKGVEGVGKSSIGEIIGKSLTCKNPINGVFCGECAMCLRNETALTTSGVSSHLVKVNMAIVAKEGSVLEQINDIFKLAKPDGHYVKILEEFHSLSAADQRLFLDETARLSPNITIIITSTSDWLIIKELRSRFLSFHFTHLSLGESSILIDKVNRSLKLKPQDYGAIYKHTGGIPRDIVLLVDFLSRSNPTRDEIDHFLGNIEMSRFVELLALTEDFRVYRDSYSELLQKFELNAVYWQFKSFLNQLVFAVEGDISDVFTKSDLRIIPSLDLQTIYKMHKIVEDSEINQVSIELMFLKIRRLFAPAQTAIDQKLASQQATALPQADIVSTVQPLTQFGSRWEK